jgi:hypothetical protein
MMVMIKYYHKQSASSVADLPYGTLVLKKTPLFIRIYRIPHRICRRRCCEGGGTGKMMLR